METACFFLIVLFNNGGPPLTPAAGSFRSLMLSTEPFDDPLFRSGSIVQGSLNYPKVVDFSTNTRSSVPRIHKYFRALQLSFKMLFWLF